MNQFHFILPVLYEKFQFYHQEMLINMKFYWQSSLTIKRFEYLPLSSVLKKQIDLAKNQYNLTIFLKIK